MARQRLDVLLVERGLAASREKAKALILAGEVRVAGQPVRSPSTTVADDAPLSVDQPARFVGRGGFKLEHALTVFNLTVSDKIAADIGASTGGFTDCLLQRGARRVYAIDVGYNQLDYRLRTDPRVIVQERVNARHLNPLPDAPNIVTIDVSFISARLILPAVARTLAEGGDVVVLIKPQFEAGRGQVGKKGVIRDPAVHRQVLREFLIDVTDAGWNVRGLTASPIVGAEGNREFLTHLTRGGSALAIDAAVDAVIHETVEREDG